MADQAAECGAKDKADAERCTQITQAHRPQVGRSDVGGIGLRHGKRGRREDAREYPGRELPFQ